MYKKQGINIQRLGLFHIFRFSEGEKKILDVGADIHATLWPAWIRYAVDMVGWIEWGGELIPNCWKIGKSTYGRRLKEERDFCVVSTDGLRVALTGGVYPQVHIWRRILNHGRRKSWLWPGRGVHTVGRIGVAIHFPNCGGLAANGKECGDRCDKHHSRTKSEVGMEECPRIRDVRGWFVNENHIMSS